MKIAMSLLSGVGYGGAVYFNNLIPALAKLDIVNEYHFFVAKGHPLIQSARQKNFVFHECVNNNQSALKRFLWEQLVLPRELKKHGIDILFTAKNLNVFLASCKTIIAIRNMEPLMFREYDNDWKLNVILWIKWNLTKWSARKADHIVAVSRAVKDCLISHFPGIEKKIIIVYNGNPVPNGRATLSVERENTQCRARSFILSSSKFVAYANQLNLLKGYARLIKMGLNMPPLWIAGGAHDKKYFQKAREYVENAGMREHARFLGIVPHDQLIALMQEATAFVFPSTLEACPHTLIEVMACGTPIATSISPPMPEIGKDAAIYFDPFDVEDIADKIKQVVFDKDIRARLQKAGPARAKDFTWEKTAQSLVDVFNNS